MWKDHLIDLSLSAKPKLRPILWILQQRQSKHLRWTLQSANGGDRYRFLCALALPCRIHFNNATANSRLILVSPVNSNLFNGLCSCSFRSVPNPGGIPERHPFLMCSRMYSICLNVASLKQEEGTFLHLSSRRSRLASISSGSGVTISRFSPRSVLCLKTNPNCQVPTSSTRLQIWSFHVVVRTRTAKKCIKMWNTRWGRAEPLFCSSIKSILYFRIPHNTLCLPPKFCINYCFQMLLGTLHIPKSIWKQCFMQNYLGGKQSVLWGIRNRELFYDALVAVVLT